MSIAKKLLEEGKGIYRLAPTWVPRAFCRPGKRIKLHPDDYYVFGLERGGVDERWFASTTWAQNGPGTPEDEGLSYIVSADGSERILLRDAVDELKGEVIGEELWNKYHKWPMFSKFFDNAGPLPHHIHHRDEHAKRVGADGKPEMYFFPSQCNNHGGEFPFTFFGLNPETTKEEMKEVLMNFAKGDNKLLDLSRAYKITLDTGWDVPPGVLHAPARSDMQGYTALYDYVIETLIPDGNNEDYIIPEGLQETGRFMQTLEEGTLFASQNNGDVRFISYNIYGWHEAGPKEQRMQMQAELIKTYQPDVIAFQEFSQYYHESFPAMLAEQGYEEVQAGPQDGINYTPLFYRTDHLELLEGGYFLYSGPNDKNTKSVTWGVFEVIETGKKFVSMSTHFLHNMVGTDYNSVRNSNATEVVALIEEIYANSEYKDIPLLMGGDLNSKAYSYCHEILQESGLQNAFDVAEVKNDSDGYHALPIYEEAYDAFQVGGVPKGKHVSAIDHVYVSENTVVKGYATLMDMYAAMSYDNSPKLVDIALD